MRETLYDDDWFSLEHSGALEQLVGRDFACSANSVQSAVQACLELLGTRSAIVPVIMPVTSPPDTLAGVLRAGGHPLLLDIDERTLQMDADQLADAIAVLLSEDNTPIVLFTRPLGDPVSSRLLDLVQDLPSIQDARLLPSPFLDIPDLSCSFNIFDLTPVIGAGAVIMHKFPEQLNLIRQIIGGPMGLSATLPQIMAGEGMIKLTDVQRLKSDYSLARDVYRDSDILRGEGLLPGLIWLQVPDAKDLGFKLSKAKIDSALGVVPLYVLEEVRRRYAQDPSYPVAHKLQNNYLCVPATEEVSKKVLELL